MKMSANKKEEESHNMIWHPYRSNNNDNDNTQEPLNETIITLRLPKNYYKTGHAVAHLLGYESFEEYVNDQVIRGIEQEIDGRGSLFDLGKDPDLKKQLLDEKWK